ncbi:MAG: hypothetical protein ACRD3F_02490 [Acidobacteriaceae bacterium]
MNLQLLRHGIGRLAGLALVFSLAGLAQAQVATHTQLTSAANGHSVTYTAKVSDIANNPATDGTVTLVNAKGASLGSAFVKNGEAAITIDQQSSGQLYANYSGSPDFRSSVAQAQLTVNANATTLPDFTLTASATSATINPGGYATVVLTITPQNGFDDMVTLSCSGQPATANCTFSPTTLTPPLDPTTKQPMPINSTLQITTQGASGKNSAAVLWPGSGSHIAYAIVLPGLLALVGLGALRRRSGLNTFRVIGMVALLAATTLGLGACAQRYDYLHHPPSGNPGIAAGNYNITVAAYSSNGATVTSHTLQVTLTVK